MYMAFGNTDELKVSIVGDTSKLKSALSEAGKNVTGFADKIGSIGRNMALVGGAVTAAFGALVMTATKAGDQFDKMALRTGLAVEELSSLSYAAKICGSSIETVENSLRFMARGMYDTSRGVGESKEAFRDLGVEVVNADGSLRSSMPVLLEVATKIAAMTNETEQAAYAGKIFGSRYGTQLMPLLKLGASGIDELMNKAKELNITISTDAASAAAKFNDKLTDLKDSLSGMGRSIGDILIPSLTEMGEKVVENIKKMTEWAKEHPKLIEGITKLGAGLGALAMVGGPVLMAAAAFSKIKEAMIAISTFSKATMIPAIGRLTASLTPLSIQLGLIAANVYIWKEVFSELNKVLKMHKTTAEDVTNANEALKLAQEKTAEKLGITVEELIEFQKKGASVSEMMGLKLIPNTDDLTGSMGELGEGIDTAKEKLNEFGQVIETFDEWVARLDEEAKKAAQVIAEAAKEAYEKYADEMKTVEDRMFELTHTQREVEIRQLDEKKSKLIEIAKQAGLSAKEEIAAIKEIIDWYKAEIDLLNKKQVILAEARYKIYKEGKLIQSLGTVGGERAEYLISQGYTAEEIPGWQPTQPGAFLPGYQAGTSYVPKTGLALIHEGEKITPAGQNTYDQRKSNSNNFYVTVTVQGDGDESKIKRVVERTFDECTRQYGRRGFELAY